VPDHTAKRYVIEVHTGVSAAEMAEAEKGTVRDGRLMHSMNSERSGVEIKTIRGDYRDADGNTRNRLRLWEKSDFVPHPDDIWQERLYAIQWITKDILGKGRQETFFAAVTADDLARERHVEAIVRENLARWQDEGLAPDMLIEPGEKTDEPIRTRGWTHWHHVFAPRQLHLATLVGQFGRNHPANYIGIANLLDRTSKLCRLDSFGGNVGREAKVQTTFYNQALNPLLNYAVRSSEYALPHMLIKTEGHELFCQSRIETLHAAEVATTSDVFVTDPPYADAVNYHEITEFFIAWLRRNPPPPFDRWTWDSRAISPSRARARPFAGTWWLPTQR
jgi:putative DNA methylase